MKGYELADKVLNLYYTYENYCFSNKQKMSINITEEDIKFLLFKDNECIDEFKLHFNNNNNKEKSLHDYTSLYLTAHVFGHINQHFDGNRIYNNAHRSYLDYRIENFPIMFDTYKFREFIEKEFSERNIFDDLEFFYLKTQNKEFKIDESFNKRIDLSKKIIRGL